MAYTQNGLTIEVYQIGVYQIPDPGGLIPNAYGLQFATGFPGGLYLDCSFYVPRRLAQYWDVRGAQRVVIRNGQRVVYEGKIDNLNGQSSGSEQGTLVECTGYWGSVMMRYKIRKRWADIRITEDVWQWVTSATAANKCTIDRQGRLRFVPKAELWNNADAAIVKYTMPTGETVKRVTYNYDLKESAGANDWAIRMDRSTDGSSWTTCSIANGDSADTNITTTSTGSLDVTLGTPSRYIRFVYTSQDNQTPTADGTYYGEFSNVTVYSETGTINAMEVGYDLINNCSELSTSQVGVAGLAGETLPSIVPLVFDEFTSLADIAQSVASYGNTSDESIYFQVRSSEDAETNDGKPLLAAGVYPDLTSADYIVRLSDANVIAADINRAYRQIANWIAVNYTDERGEQQVITPDDSGYEALTDATSVTKYGRRVEPIDSGTFVTAMASSSAPWIIKNGRPVQAPRVNTATLALYYGKRYLAKWKYPVWRGSITVTGYIYGTGGNQIPASEIEAGKVLDIADYIVDEILPTDTLDYPRVIITATSYDADTEQCVITFGPLDDLQMLKQETVGFASYDTPAVTGAASGDGKKGKLNWKRKMGLTPGTPEWDEAVKLGKAKWMEKYKGKTKKKG